MGGGGEPRKWRVTASSAFFKVKWPVRRPHCTQLSQNIAKSMVYIINQSYGDFQEGGCLHKSTSGIQWTPEHSRTSDRPRNKPQQKQTCQHLTVVYWQLVSLLMELSIDGEKLFIDMVCVSGGFWQSRPQIL